MPVPSLRGPSRIIHSPLRPRSGFFQTSLASFLDAAFLNHLLHLTFRSIKRTGNHVKFKLAIFVLSVQSATFETGFEREFGESVWFVIVINHSNAKTPIIT